MSEAPNTEGRRAKGNGAARPPSADATPSKAVAVFADMAKLREEHAASLIESEEVLVACPVRKPQAGEFFRVHPDPSMSEELWIYDDRVNQTVYFVMPHVVRWMQAQSLGRDVRLARHVTCVNQAGVVFLWPIKQGSNSNTWSSSALNIARQAKTQWVRLVGELKKQSYSCFVAKGELPEPRWPEQAMQELLILAFDNQIIDSPDHKVIRRLQGLETE